MGKFHAHSGWFFERLHDDKGRVRIMVKPDGHESPLTDIIFDASTWASIVASVAPQGDTADTFQAAAQLHDGRTPNYRSALQRIKLELGVPGEDTPAPVLEAWRIADNAL